MDQIKPWWASRTIWVGIIAALFGVLSGLGVLPEGLTQEATVEIVMVIVGVFVVIFRKTATKSVGSS